ncbi:MBL fold metallo-hydrolase [Microbulbifer sp. SSSA002]|uniref:MBL fold metallo-hydrolase n=1 Tax=unclassified Microbulbifer TaxID=2619833 RepID=UPI004039ECCF
MNIFKILFSITFILASSTASSSISKLKISEQLYILSGKEYGTNIGLIAVESGLILIDPMPGDNHLSELDQVIQSIHNEPVVFILNTHVHSDHTGGNKYFEGKGGQLIEGNLNIEGFAHVRVKSHSSDDNIYYHKKSNAIFVGDIFDTSWHPTFYAGGVEGFNNAVDAILNLGDDQSLIIPGHGVTASKSALVEFRENTFAWINRVRELYQKGSDLEKIMADTQVKSILQRFNVSGKAVFVPKRAYKRFIERTIAVIDNEESFQQAH